MQWMLAAILLISGASVFTSCTSDNDDNPAQEQEIASEIKFLNKYEGASTVEGTYKGKSVKGYTYVEMLGDWTD